MADSLFTADFKDTPYWWDAAPRPEPSEAAPPAKVDVVVVGSGNVGLSAALPLASRLIVRSLSGTGRGGLLGRVRGIEPPTSRSTI